MDTNQYPPENLSQPETWREGTRRSVAEVLDDPIIAKLLGRSSLTRAQFETLLVDQIGHEIANKRLTRHEMAQVMRNRNGISRGAMNRTLKQAKRNVSQSIHTILLLGYGGLFESPSLSRFVEASEQLKSQTSQLRDSTQKDPELYSTSVKVLLDNLEEAFGALFDGTRDT